MTCEVEEVLFGIGISYPEEMILVGQTTYDTKYLIALSLLGKVSYI